MNGAVCVHENPGTRQRDRFWRQPEAVGCLALSGAPFKEHGRPKSPHYRLRYASRMEESVKGKLPAIFICSGLRPQAVARIRAQKSKTTTV